ncbi:MAG: hypothetical protein KGN84_22970 [Acidobacteriota bacterium]|nr:hypothetical protein [Acidobacteriota bacterium]
MQALRIIAFSLALVPALAFEKGPSAPPVSAASDLGRKILAAGLDPAECYRVRDLEISEGDARIYLTEGYLMFGRPIEGTPLTAVFSADADGGDAEVLLLPPNRSERKTMAAYTGSPNLDEHFTQAAFIFTDTSARNLIREVQAGPARKSPEMGALMGDRWNRIVANLMSGFESRIVLDLLSPGEHAGFFQALISGRKLGNFDVIYDGRGYEQMLAGQIGERNGVSYWDTWTSFTARNRQGLPQAPPEEQILSYRIEASLDAALTMHCVTRIRLRATEASRKLLAFDLSGEMRATSARVDGVPAEVYERESVRQGLVQNTGNELLLVLPEQPLEPGSEHEVEIDHEGKVVQSAGHDVYYATSRGAWYPSRGVQFAAYDVTYRYPAGLDLVAAGQVKEDRVEGDMRVTRRVPEDRLRILGFNLGRFEKMQTSRDGISVEALANRQVEDALRPRPPEPALPQLELHPRRGVQPAVTPDMTRPAPLPPPPPVNQLSQIANEVQDAMSFYRQRFGEPLQHHLEVTPLPGRFGQGFGGIIYLPTVNYLLGDAVLVNKDSAIFRDLLVAHEVAHQWWGNIVTTTSYHNEWLMEALSNYCAVMYMESKDGPHATEVALDLYRRRLFLKGADGVPAESVGPVVQGRRLESSANPNAAIAVMYGKGSWIMHMLRRRMGDGQFLKMLAEVRRRYQFQSLDVEEFRALCAEFLPPDSPDPKLENFFEQWVYGTGVPSLKLTYAVKGNKLTGAVTQSEVDDDFSVPVPVEIQTGRGKITKIVRTSGDPVTFTAAVAGPNAKAVLDPAWSVLKR